MPEAEKTKTIKLDPEALKRLKKRLAKCIANPDKDSKIKVQQERFLKKVEIIASKKEYKKNEKELKLLNKVRQEKVLQCLSCSLDLEESIKMSLLPTDLLHFALKQETQQIRGLSQPSTQGGDKN